MSFIKIITSSHVTAFKILDTVKKNPAKNLNTLARLLNMHTSKLCVYMETLHEFQWIDKQSQGQQNLHVITDKGRIACIALEYLTTGLIPLGVEIVEEE